MKSTFFRRHGIIATFLASALILSGLSVGSFVANIGSVRVVSQAAYADTVLDRVEDRIEDTFKKDSILRHYKLDADEEDGHIEIEGRVHTHAERERAYRIARSLTPQRYRVINKIRIGNIGR